MKLPPQPQAIDTNAQDSAARVEQIRQNCRDNLNLALRLHGFTIVPAAGATNPTIMVDQDRGVVTLVVTCTIPI